MGHCKSLFSSSLHAALTGLFPPCCALLRPQARSGATAVGAVTRQNLVDGVIHDLVDQMMQPLVLNALSEWLEVEVKSSGHLYRQRFELSDSPYSSIILSVCKL